MSLTSIFTDIANAIRAKTGKTAAMTPAEMVTEVENINTNEDYVDCLITTLERPAGAIDMVLPDTVTEIKSSAYANWNYSAANYLRSFVANEITSCPASFMASNGRLESVHIPKATIFYGAAFMSTPNLTDLVIAPAIHRVDSQAFYNCGCILTELNTEKYYDEYGTLTAPRIVGQAFSRCKNIPHMKIKGPVDIGSRPFSECTFTKLWISKDIRSLSTYLPGTSAITDIYTDADAAPSSWPTNWDCISGTTYATVHYSVSEAEFDAIVEEEETT